MKNRVEKYIKFEKRQWEHKKTCNWFVINTRTNDICGEIKWHGAWRKYCFFPSDDTLYDSDCLRLIADFCSDRSKEHYGKAKEKKISKTL